MDDFEEELPSLRVEDENSTVDGLSRQVTFKRLVDCDAVDVGIVDEKLDLVAEQLGVVLGVQKLLAALRSVEL